MKHDVIIETTATSDLYGIFSYISDVLMSAESAQRVYTAVKNKIFLLNTMPTRFPLVKDEPYASLGVRLMPVENYHVFYIIREKNVHVFRILYHRRNWQNLLFDN